MYVNNVTCIRNGANQIRKLIEGERHQLILIFRQRELNNKENVKVMAKILVYTLRARDVRYSCGILKNDMEKRGKVFPRACSRIVDLV